MSDFRRSQSERRAESFGQRRLHQVDREPKFHRLAGEIFGVESRERARQQNREVRSRLQASRPVGVGFGEKDNYGPDDSWDTKDPIKHTPSPNYYNVR